MISTVILIVFGALSAGAYEHTASQYGLFVGLIGSFWVLGSVVNTQQGPRRQQRVLEI